MLFCIVISLSGPILGREALGWFVDMSAIGASIGYLCTCAATLVTMRRFGDGTGALRVMAVLGVAFSACFIILQLVPIPGSPACTSARRAISCSWCGSLSGSCSTAAAALISRNKALSPAPLLTIRKKLL